MKHETQTSSISSNLESPIIKWAVEEFGEAITDNNKSQFMDLLGPGFVRESLWFVYDHHF